MGAIIGTVVRFLKIEVYAIPKSEVSKQAREIVRNLKRSEYENWNCDGNGAGNPADISEAWKYCG